MGVDVSWTEPDDATTTCAGGAEACADRTASNTVQCNSGINYGFYLKLAGLNYHYSLSNGTFTEYEDGTAVYAGHLTNIGNSSYQFDVELISLEELFLLLRVVRRPIIVRGMMILIGIIIRLLMEHLREPMN